MIISRAEQQFVLKTQDKSALLNMFEESVLSHKRLCSVKRTDCEAAVSKCFIFDVVNLLGEPCEIVFCAGTGQWCATLGGQRAKKIAVAYDSDVGLAIIRSMIIFVRKYL